MMQPSTGGLAESPDSSTNLVRDQASSLLPDNSFLKNRSRLPEWLTLLGSASLIAFAIPYHEPWADEAQAWQLARSLSLTSLFHNYIRYEGSPGLWHFLLWILIHAHVTYTGLQWVCGAIAVAATALLVFRSPLPRYLRLSLPFTFFLLYQYAVVARNYVLAPLLLYLAAICWKKSPALLALVLGLLANVALHTAVISGGLAIVYLIVQMREGALQKPSSLRRLLPAAAILLSFYAFAVWTAWPPRDMALVRVLGQGRSFIEWAVVALVGGVCSPWVLAIPFWILIVLWFSARQKLLYLLPLLLFVGFSGVVHVAFWHMGLVIPTLVCILWITWPDSNAGLSSSAEAAGRWAMIFLIATQILWSAFAIVYDHNHPFSPDLAAAKFLKPYVQKGDRIAITWVNKGSDHPSVDYPQFDPFDAVGLLPYFDRSIFVNQPSPFWSWSNHNSTDRLFNQLLPTRPEIILIEMVQTEPRPLDLSDPKIALLEHDGYRLTNIFCGSMPARFHPQETNCHVVLQYAGHPK
jgi:hypothetical protein